jgi:hypothetical protein
MSYKFRIAIGFALLLSLIFAVPAWAGGWAVITLDELPTNVVAGEPIKIGFTVRQHGVTLLDGLYPTVTAALLKEDQFVVQAESDGRPGHYTATLSFPREGNWTWSIQAFTMDQPMPALHVAAGTVASTDQPTSKIESSPVSSAPLLLFRVLVFGIALIGLFLAFQRKSRLAGIAAGLSLVVGIGTFMLGAVPPVVEAQSKQDSKLSAEASPAQAELGRQLFLAKGCITCHYNNRAADRSEYWTIEMGAPDLSNYSAHPDVLFIRLKDPIAAKSDAKMPNLELKETEIEALIAFINSK